jgi:hypothetical protein
MKRINLFTYFGFYKDYSPLIREDLKSAGIAINQFAGVDSSVHFVSLERALNEFIGRCQHSDDMLPSIALLHLGLTYSKGHEDDFIALIKNGREKLRNLHFITEGNGYQCDKDKLETTKSASDFHVNNITSEADAHDPIVDYINRILT